MQNLAIKLSLLQASPKNVRKTMSKEGFNELKSSILSHGLIQNLVVVKKGEKFEVIAGSRRLAAINELLKEGKLKEEPLISCNVVSEDGSAEKSLAENIVREAMHPADEFEAFAELRKTLNPINIATRFGVTPKYVEQRLLLGNVHPDIIKAFRAEKIDLDSVMAFTICPDQKKQQSVFKSLKEHERRSWSIKNKLTEKTMPSDSGYALFVGKDEYIKAGGVVLRDLFSSDEDEELFEDGALLTKLADKKVSEKVAAYKKACWGFVEYGDENNHWNFCNKFETLKAQPKKDDLPNCGIYLYISHEGKLVTKMLKKRGKESEKAIKKQKSEFSQALVDDLKAYRMEAFQVAVADNVIATADLLCYSAALTVLDGVYYSDHFSELHFSKASSSKTVVNEDTAAKKSLKKIKAELDMSWNKGTNEQKFENFIAMDNSKKSKFLCYAFAGTLRGRIDDKLNTYTLAGIRANVDVAKLWRPTKENFFSRVSCEVLTKIGKEIFVKDWNAKLVTKKQLVTFLSDAFKDPKKAAGGDQRIQKALETWLPSGMGFNAVSVAPKEKSKK